jgi:hypothetical protein
MLHNVVAIGSFAEGLGTREIVGLPGMFCDPWNPIPELDTSQLMSHVTLSNDAACFIYGLCTGPNTISVVEFAVDVPIRRTGNGSWERADAVLCHRDLDES